VDGLSVAPDISTPLTGDVTGVVSEGSTSLPPSCSGVSTIGIGSAVCPLRVL